MTDLIERLRWRANKYDSPGWLMPNCVNDLREAADEIERLTAFHNVAIRILSDSALQLINDEAAVYGRSFARVTESGIEHVPLSEALKDE